MTPVRVLLATLLCSCFAVGQNPSTSKNELVADAVSSPVPWQIAAPRTPQDPLTRIQNGSVLLSNGPRAGVFGADSQVKSDQITISLNGPGDDTTCYAIRSYVVARDRKDSDSTHPVRYSTCQPASRYRLRTTVQNEGKGR